MPELPEVEVSRLGISPHLIGQTIGSITTRVSKLRFEIPSELQTLVGYKINDIIRRAKYLLIKTDAGSAIIHLGMSGSLKIIDTTVLPVKHDHVDLILTNGKVLRYHDPRRFGAWLWVDVGKVHHLLAHMGVEPLTDAFNAQYMLAQAHNKKMMIKQFLMTNKIVVGIGNIYASEALFQAKIAPTNLAGSITYDQWKTLVAVVKQTLLTSIKQGGTTLKDFAQVDGKPGYFAQQLLVYGRAGEPCPECASIINSLKIGQRNTFFCSNCQQ